MAQVFVSHSRADKEYASFFMRAFTGKNVRAVFEELEALEFGEVTPQKVAQDIENSVGVFTILSRNVQSIPHTRDWVLWENGVGQNKQVWVFEPAEEFGSVDVVVPRLNHYVLFDETDACLAYTRKIIESYDDSQVLRAAVLTGIAGAAAGALLTEKKRDVEDNAALGGLVGALAGAKWADKKSIRPPGFPFLCSVCKSSYSVHLSSRVTSFRCTVCNSFWKLQREAGSEKPLTELTT